MRNSENSRPERDQGKAEPEESGQAGTRETAAHELRQLREERDTLLDRLTRQQADFENARKRSTREQQDFREYALANSLQSLLPILDSFEHALAYQGDPEQFLSGMQLIHKQLLDALGKMGVQRVPAEGGRFDPRYHEAVEVVEAPESEGNQVLAELQHGYKLKDRLLRPARVRVSRKISA
jgi:molecular chaperone GrpE